MSLGEFELISRYFGQLPPGTGVHLGIGDDAALLDAGPRVAVAASHWMPSGDVPPAGDAVAHALVREAAARLRAAGAPPRWLFLNLSLNGHDAGWLRAFADALQSAAADLGASLAGGDTTHGVLAADLFAIGPVAGTARERS